MRTAIGRVELCRRLAGWHEAGFGPTYERLASALRAAVLDGRVPVGQRLPAERELADEMGLSRTTVSAAYRRLRERGFLVSRQGSGSYTAMPEGRSRSRVLLGPAALAGDDDVIDLAIAALSPDGDALTAAVTAAQGELPEYLASFAGPGCHGYYSAGIPPLREAIAERYTKRGVATEPEQILVTTGGMGAIHLAARTLLGARDIALIESPTYPNAIDALRGTGARLAGVPVAQDSDVSLLASTLRSTRPRMLYLIPDFHNPTGAVLDERAREELVRVARETGTLLLADETTADLALDGQTPPPPVAAYDIDGRVVTVGSMSKSFWGGLRLGWIRATPALVEELAAARATIDMASAVFEQLIATALLADAEYVLGRRCSTVAAQRDAMLRLLAERFPDWSWQRPSGGLVLWVRLDAPISTALTEAAERHGVRLAAGPRFGLDGAFERYLRLPYTRPPEELDEAMCRLAAAHAEVRAGRPPRRPTPTCA